jgi:hypothetical protein
MPILLRQPTNPGRYWPGFCHAAPGELALWACTDADSDGVGGGSAECHHADGCGEQHGGVWIWPIAIATRFHHGRKPDRHI